MDWPTSTDYIEAFQNLKHTMGDEELRTGEAALTPLGMPMLWSGNFADVFKIHNSTTGKTWAVKCFTRKVQGREGRYGKISDHLKKDKANLPFMVDFSYLRGDDGILIRGERFPVLKMKWVEQGIQLNDFVEEYLDRPQMLRKLLDLWPKMAVKLRDAKIAHADLQHGNVLLIPEGNRGHALRLIDYDGMFVPTFKGMSSEELGHPNFQHPQRIREGVYSIEVDRFSHLVIYSAIHSLTVGGKGLWNRFNNGENLLFREGDFQDVANSEAFQTLWQLNDVDTRMLIGRLALACKQPLEKTPLLKNVVNGQVRPLTKSEEDRVAAMLGRHAALLPTAVAESHEKSLPMPDLMGDLAPKEPMPLQPSPEAPSESLATGIASYLRRARWPALLLMPLHVLDWPLKIVAGKDNRILLNFLRIAIATVLTLTLIVAGTRVSLSPGAKSATSPAVSESPSEQLAETSVSSSSASIPSTGTAFTNSIGMPFTRIPAGEFLMGSPDNDPAKTSAETPQHRVEISQPFLLGTHEVTQQQFEQIMSVNPSRFKDPSHPVERVSWTNSTEFCTRLSESDDNYNYRLPTEAEWEYACRAGTTTEDDDGDGLDPARGWFRDNSRGQTHPAGQASPNKWGLYDMQGNVWEWCADWYDGNYYWSSPAIDPTGPATGANRVRRGGGYNSGAWYCRSASRSGMAPDENDSNLGFRVVAVPTN